MKRLIAFMLAACVFVPTLLFSFAGCGKKGTETEGAPTEKTPENPGVLTEVFRESERFLIGDENGVTYSRAATRFDPDKNALTTAGWVREEERGNSDDPDLITRETLCVRLDTFGGNGDLLSSVEMPPVVLDDPTPDGSERIYFYSGAVAESRFLWITLCPAPNLSVTLHAADLDGGNYASCDALALRSTATQSMSVHFAVSEDGTVWLGWDDEVLALSPGLELLYRIITEETVEAIGVTPDGVPLFATGPYTCKKLWKLDPDTRKYAFARDFTADSTEGVKIFFGRGYDYFYEETRQQKTLGVYGVRDGEDVLVMNTMNSSVASGLAMLSAADAETLLYGTGESTGRQTFVVVRHAADIDLSSIPTLEIAALNKYGRQNIELRINEYNKTHPDCRVVLTVRDPYEEMSAGVNRLAFDLVNGGYQPDIIWGSPEYDAVETLVRKGLCLELEPFMEADPLVYPDNFFGSVRTYFESEDGGFWGVSPDFSIQTMAARRDMLGKYADKGSWSLAEFIDYAESLPDGVLLGQYLTQFNISPVLGASAFNQWIDYDEAICHFTDEDFLAFLRFYKSLPENAADIQKKYPFAAQFLAGTAAEASEPYRNDQVAVYTGFIASITELHYGLDTEFGTIGTDDLVLIGTPTADGEPNSRLSCQNTFVISKNCSDPERAWDVIRYVFAGTVDENGRFTGALPSLKSTCDELTETMKAWKTKVDMTSFQSMTYVNSTGDASFDPQADANSMIVVMTDEDATRIKNYLDTAGGARYLDTTPDEITEIIGEEIDAYLSSNTSEASAAKNIQSRVSIWLAEHK